MIWNWKDAGIYKFYVSLYPNGVKYNKPFTANQWQFVYVSYDKNTGRLIMENGGTTTNVIFGSKTFNAANFKLGIGKRLYPDSYTTSEYKGKLACLNIFNSQIDANAVRNRCAITGGKGKTTYSPP